MTCATVQIVTRRIDADDPRLTAHRMPMALATETIMDCASTAGQMHQAIAHGQPQSEVQHYRDLAKAQFESYLDLMAEAAHHAGQLRP
ncbi:hypothetical protein D1604_12740 [Brevundimonas sp. LPMIX5]|nr:hypothetical protein D1604_12740 [Brevundimonas sp. LPMIX5]